MRVVNCWGMTTAQNQLLSPGALAARWEYHPESVRRKIRNGTLPAIRIGGRLRVPLEAIEKIESDGRVIRGNPEAEGPH